MTGEEELDLSKLEYNVRKLMELVEKQQNEISGLRSHMRHSSDFLSRYVWKFHFATSFSFSLVEQLVGNSIWNTT